LETTTTTATEQLCLGVHFHIVFIAINYAMGEKSHVQNGPGT